MINVAAFEFKNIDELGKPVTTKMVHVNTNSQCLL